MKKQLSGIWRHIRRNKVFALINTVGLTIGITCSLIMFVIVKFELGFDKFHSNYDNLYRVTSTHMNNGNLRSSVGVPKPLADAIRSDITGIKEVTHFSSKRFGAFTLDNKNGEQQQFTEFRGVVYVEPAFFRMFDWALLEGSREGLNEPNTVIVDKAIADKFFPEESAVGKMVKMNGSLDLKVIGVVNEMPRQSDFPFNVFISMETMRKDTDFTQWYSTNSDDRCYVLLDEGADPSRIMEQFDGFVDKHYSEESTTEFVLQPLSEVHFDQVLSNLNYRPIAWNLIYTLSAVSVLMILTACFNFINMSTAVALKRAREVGIRKVLGSTRKQLIKSFLLETFAITFVATCLSLAIAERLLPGMVSEFVNARLSLNLWSDAALMVYLMSLLLGVTLLAGLYPAWMISAFKPANLIRGSVGAAGGRGLNLRRVLVVFQFALSQVFIVGTLIVLWQMNYIKNADLGFRKDQMVTLDIPRGATNHSDVWTSTLNAIPGVEDFTFAQASPFSGMSSSTDAVYYKDTVEQRFTVFLKPADPNYIPTYELELLAGEGLMESEKVNRYVVNEAFVRKMGLTDPSQAIGQMISISSDEKIPISGVVKDYHMRSMKTEVKPAAIFHSSNNYWHLGLKLRADQAEEALDAIETTWKDLYPEEDYRPVYMETYIGWYYSGEDRFFRMLMTFAIVAILISCLGLYGMISFMTNQRAREIGIRKVLGASVSRIIALFSTEFAKLVLVAFIIAAPLAYLGMKGWLNDFAYRIELGPAIFLAGISVSLIITLFTIGYRSLRAGQANPVESLRDQ